MFQRGWFQIDVKRQELLPELLGVVHQYGPARVKAVTPDVLAELGQDGRFAGLIVQLGAETRAKVERITRAQPRLPVLALLEPSEAGQLNALHALGISTMMLPLSSTNVVQFVQRALSHHFVPCSRVGALIVELAESRMLTAREVQLVSYCLGDEPRSRVRRRLGITENTLKSQIRGLLRKCGERNLDALAKNVLRSALLYDGDVSPSGEAAVSSHSEVTRPALRVA